MGKKRKKRRPSIKCKAEGCTAKGRRRTGRCLPHDQEAAAIAHQYRQDEAYAAAQRAAGVSHVAAVIFPPGSAAQYRLDRILQAAQALKAGQA